MFSLRAASALLFLLPLIVLDKNSFNLPLEEHNKIKKELKNILDGTIYEGRTIEIIDFISAKKNQGKKALYIGSLHTFGQKDGRAIYQLIKNGINKSDYIPPVPEEA